MDSVIFFLCSRCGRFRPPEPLTGRERAQNIARPSISLASSKPHSRELSTNDTDTNTNTNTNINTGRAPVHSRGLLSQSTTLFSCLLGLVVPGSQRGPLGADRERKYHSKWKVFALICSNFRKVQEPCVDSRSEILLQMEGFCFDLHYILQNAGAARRLEIGNFTANRRFLLRFALHFAKRRSCVETRNRKFYCK